MKDNLKSEAARSEAKVRDKAAEGTEDDYVPVFQPIMPDEWTTADEKLNEAIERMVDQTIGDLPIYKSQSKSSGNDSAKTKKDSDASKSGQSKMSGPKLFAIIFLAVLVTLVGAYAWEAYKYTEIFIDGTFINGVDVGGMTVDEVESQIATGVETYKLDVNFKNGDRETLVGKDFGYAYVPSDNVKKILEDQNILLWINGKFGQTVRYTVDEATTYDKEKLAALLEALPERQPENEDKPKNAYLKLKSDNTFTIIPETEGFVVLPDKLLEVVSAAVENGERKLDLTLTEDVYEHAAVTKDDEELNVQMNDLNAFLDTTITYDLPGGLQQILDRHTTAKWIAQSDDGFYYINTDFLKEDVAAYIAELAGTIDYEKDTREFKSTKRGTVELKCDKYGTTVDQETETEALMTNLINHMTEEREPAYIRNDPVPPADFEGTYVEVDYDNQHMYFYKEGKLIVDSACVTGRKSSGTTTPKGVFSIYSKQKNRTLHGPQREDGSYEYESFVKYWMPFLRGYGLHDASWRSDYGGDIYLNGGSHGCVNLPEGKAAVLYENVDVGTPVIVF